MRRSFSLVLRLTCLLALAPGHLWAADAAKYPPHFKPEPIAASLRDAFYEAFIGGKAVSAAPEVPDDKQADPKLKDVWLGNKPELSATMDSVEVEFRPIDDPANAGGQAFVLTFLFKFDYDGARQIVVRTSKPGSSLYEGGIIFRLVGPKVRKAVLRGQRGTHVLLGTPESLQDGIYGILACPLTVVAPTRNEAGEMQAVAPIRYRPFAVRMNGLEGMVEGTALSGVRPGMARANIATSPGLANEGLHFDETFSKDPHVQVRYQGAPNSEFLPVEEGGRLVEGMKLQLELQTNAGYTRETELVELLEVAPVERQLEFGAVLQGKEMRADNTQCYSVLRSSQIRNMYSRSEFVIPR